MLRSIRTTIGAGALALGLLATVQALPLHADAAASLPAPAGVAATRVQASANDFVVSWKPVSGPVDHYNVSVFYGGEDHVTTVAADVTQLPVTGVDYTTQYRVTVSSRDAAGDGRTSPVTVLEPAVPGPPRTLSAIRSGSGDTLAISWTDPRWPGYQGLSSYDVIVTQMADQKVVLKETTKDFSTKVSGVDMTKQYSVKVMASNTYGVGAIATALVGNDKPGTPTSLVGTRDAKSPSVVHVTWAAPAYIGTSPIEYYEVMSGVGRLKDTLKVTTTSADIELDASRTGHLAVRACNASGCSLLGPKLQMNNSKAVVSSAIATSSPFVLVTNSAGLVTVETRGYIGASSVYPRLVFRVFPTMGNGGYTDVQTGQNGARVLRYTTVPTGTYTVTVAGLPATGGEVEIARKVIIVNGDGQLSANQWEVVRGSASISGTDVTMTASGENRVLSTKPLASPDMVLSTDATLSKGAGYGIWFRAGMDSQNRIFGYTFQYDPLYGNAFIIRHWYQGNECSSPIAKSAFPSDFPINALHRLIVVVKGDTVWASVDGVEMFRVASLTQAAAASPCKYPAPTGTRIGFRTWNTSVATFSKTTLR